MIAAYDVDLELRRVNQAVAGYIDGLGMNAKKVLAWQCGLLQTELANAMLPRDKGRTEKAIARDVLRVFAPLPTAGLLPQRKQGKGDIVWFEAGPKWLTGTSREFWKPEASTMDSIYRVNSVKRDAGGAYTPLGKKYRNRGTRGKQHIRFVSRFLMRKSIIETFQRKRFKLIGKLKASFCKGLKVIGVPVKMPPRWIANHIEDSRGDFVNGLDAPQPHIEIISRQSGCEKPEVQQIAATVLHWRAEKMTRHIAYLSRPSASGKARPMEWLYE